MSREQNLTSALIVLSMIYCPELSFFCVFQTPIMADRLNGHPQNIHRRFLPLRQEMPPCSWKRSSVPVHDHETQAEAFLDECLWKLAWPCWDGLTYSRNPAFMKQWAKEVTLWHCLPNWNSPTPTFFLHEEILLSFHLGHLAVIFSLSNSQISL